MKRHKEIFIVSRSWNSWTNQVVSHIKLRATFRAVRAFQWYVNGGLGNLGVKWKHSRASRNTCHLARAHMPHNFAVGRRMGLIFLYSTTRDAFVRPVIYHSDWLLWIPAFCVLWGFILYSGFVFVTIQKYFNVLRKKK